MSKPDGPADPRIGLQQSTGVHVVVTTLATASAIRAEIELLKDERTRWRDFVVKQVITPDTFIVIEKPLVERITALEHALVFAGPELPRIA